MLLRDNSRSLVYVSTGNGTSKIVFIPNAPRRAKMAYSPSNSRPYELKVVRMERQGESTHYKCELVHLDNMKMELVRTGNVIALSMQVGDTMMDNVHAYERDDRVTFN